ncbi:hypothetical protein AtubIFM57258_002523 [Aspergillus tubingensis]|nr:hypothetical protein AtubIFM57258_002523 [Aspergillus tubingensis]
MVNILVALTVSLGSGFKAAGSNVLLPTTTVLLNNVRTAEAILQDRIQLYVIPTQLMTEAQNAL